MANAGSTFVSQNRGANQPDRVRRGMRQMYLYSVVVMVAAVVLMNFGAQWMVQLISGSSEPIVIELVGKVIFVLLFIPKFQYNAVILCEPIIWFFMTAYLVAVYLHEPFVFPKK